MANLLFYVMAAGAVGAAFGVVLARNPLISVLSLLGSFFCLAGIYLLAGFQLIAALQILTYAGAILVLFLFVIMLLNLAGVTAVDAPEPTLGERFRGRRGAWAVAVAGALSLVAGGVALTVGGVPATGPMPEHGIDQPIAMAQEMFGRYLLPFEATSLLLLATAVAVVVLAKRERVARPRAEGRSDATAGDGAPRPTAAPRRAGELPARGARARGEEPTGARS